ncbi:MurT ligase domain-containing protein [uncultured Faecalicoccus sp.]|uniref:Mur ligase family protein n=1 Tax=uncultured Faecalicoccus sp. TaxID=1971760 RepID=UPI00261C4B67|nr:MurT ligase domain-containing protein [uncultured Faecalicoccus sp.]
MKSLSILSTKISAFLLGLVGRGGSLPGSIGLKLDPNILQKLTFDGPVILVTGTNGKTSTANMIADLFDRAGYSVVSNRKGDNLKAGICTALLTNSSLSGKVKANACVLEVDELNIRHILPFIPVRALVVNNFFRDQLDRAREMEQLIDSIEKVLPEYDQELILNGNDPNVIRLALKAPKAHCSYFGIAKNKYSTDQTKEASEGKFCPCCGSKLVYNYYQYSHIGNFYCENCDFKTPVLDVELSDIDLSKENFKLGDMLIHSPYEGMYSMYNCAAVLAVAKHFDVDLKYALEVFAHAPQPKGRNEHFVKEGQECILNLIKNPTGANEVMKVIDKDEQDKVVCIVLNDHEQDGTDVSWIYDTFFEKICKESTKGVVCTGTRAYDMALRIYYENYKGKIEIYNSIDEAIQKCLHSGLKCYAIATYTALLPTRNAIVKEMN